MTLTYLFHCIFKHTFLFTCY